LKNKANLSLRKAHYATQRIYDDHFRFRYGKNSECPPFLGILGAYPSLRLAHLRVVG
jgi:hypothetical protein